MRLVRIIDIVGRYWRVSELDNILTITINRDEDSSDYFANVKVFTIVDNIHSYVKSKSIAEINRDKEWIFFIDFEPNIYASEDYRPIFDKYSSIDRLSHKGLYAGHLSVPQEERVEFIKKIITNLLGKQFKLSIDGEEV